MMTMNKFATLAAATLAASFAAGSASATTMMIDGFDDGQSVAAQPFSVPGFEQFSEVAGSMLGGFRDMFVTSTGSGFAATQLAANSKNSRAEFSNNAGVSGTFQITWDGADNSAAVDTDGLGGIDVTAGGANTQFAFEVLSADLAGNSLDLTVWDMAGNSFMVASEDTEELMLGATPQALTFSFAEYLGVDMTNVGAIQLSYDGTSELDISFDSVRAETVAPVPLPAGILLLGGALAALGGLRRRG